MYSIIVLNKFHLNREQENDIEFKDTNLPITKHWSQASWNLFLDNRKTTSWVTYFPIAVKDMDNVVDYYNHISMR